MAYLGKINMLWLFYLGPIFVLVLLSALAVAPYGLSWKQINSRTRFLLKAAAVSLVGLLVEVYFRPHYAAPMTALILVLVLQAMRYLSRWQWRRKPTGLAIVRAICWRVFAIADPGQPLASALVDSPRLVAHVVFGGRAKHERAEVLAHLQNRCRENIWRSCTIPRGTICMMSG